MPEYTWIFKLLLGKKEKKLTSVSFAFTHTYTLVKTNIFPHGIFEKWAKTEKQNIVPCYLWLAIGTHLSRRHFFYLLCIFHNFPCLLGGKTPKMLVFTRVYVCVKAKLTLGSCFWISLQPSLTHYCIKCCATFTHSV